MQNVGNNVKYIYNINENYLLPKNSTKLLQEKFGVVYSAYCKKAYLTNNTSLMHGNINSLSAIRCMVIMLKNFH